MLIAIIIAVFMFVIFALPQMKVKQFTNVGLTKREANKIALQLIKKEKKHRTYTWAC
jgi:hypothetical protein